MMSPPPPKRGAADESSTHKEPAISSAAPVRGNIPRMVEWDLKAEDFESPSFAAVHGQTVKDQGSGTG